MAMSGENLTGPIRVGPFGVRRLPETQINRVSVERGADPEQQSAFPFTIRCPSGAVVDAAVFLYSKERPQDPHGRRLVGDVAATNVDLGTDEFWAQLRNRLRTSFFEIADGKWAQQAATARPAAGEVGRFNAGSWSTVSDALAVGQWFGVAELTGISRAFTRVTLEEKRNLFPRMKRADAAWFIVPKGDVEALMCLWVANILSPVYQHFYPHTFIGGE